MKIIYETKPRTARDGTKIRWREGIEVKGDMSNIVPVFDSTDHFAWACTKCKEIAQVKLVKRDDSYAQEPTLYFFLVCPKCETTTQKKIYLEDTDKSYLQMPTATELLGRG